MADNYTSEVIKYLRRKGSSGFEPISYLGSEQRFVGALRNSNDNNLEEQFVLGTDTYTEMYDDNEGNHIIEKSFCITDMQNPSSTDIDSRTNYYKVITTIYNNEHENTDYQFGDNGLIFSNRLNDVAFGNETTYPDIDSLYLLDNTTFIYSNGILKIEPHGFYISRKDELYFIKQGEPDLLVLTKLTTERKSADGRIAIREQIINALNPS